MARCRRLNSTTTTKQGNGRGGSGVVGTNRAGRSRTRAQTSRPTGRPTDSDRKLWQSVCADRAKRMSDACRQTDPARSGCTLVRPPTARLIPSEQTSSTTTVSVTDARAGVSVAKTPAKVMDVAKQATSSVPLRASGRTQRRSTEGSETEANYSPDDGRRSRIPPRPAAAAALPTICPIYCVDGHDHIECGWGRRSVDASGSRRRTTTLLRTMRSVEGV